MTGDLEAAARAFRRAEKTLDDRRRALAEAIVTADRAGVRQAEIVRITGYTREHIRQLLKSAGAE
jgi:hypothetical protein